MPLPRFHLPRRRSSSIGMMPGLTISQRLTRAGLAFIVFGVIASFLPTNSVALAIDAECGTSSVWYRLTDDPAGGMDTVDGTYQPADTPLNFYVFESTTGDSGPYHPYTPSAWSATYTGYSPTTGPAGNTFVGMTNAASPGFTLPGEIVATVPSGDLVIQFKVAAKGDVEYRITDDPAGGPMNLPGKPLPNGTLLKFYIFQSTGGGSFVPSTVTSWTITGAFAAAPGVVSAYEYDGKDYNTTAMNQPASITATMPGGMTRTYYWDVSP